MVYIFGSSSDPGESMFDIPQGQVSGGAVFGYGTTAGKDVLAGRSLQRMHYALNEVALRTAADSLGIPFQHRERGVLDVDTLATAVPPAASSDPIISDEPHPNRIEFYWIFTAIAAGLFGLELYDLARHWLRRRFGGVRI
jgi:hypothetical protein